MVCHQVCTFANNYDSKGCGKRKRIVHCKREHLQGNRGEKLTGNKEIKVIAPFLTYH